MKLDEFVLLKAIAERGGGGNKNPEFCARRPNLINSTNSTTPVTASVVREGGGFGYMSNRRVEEAGVRSVVSGGLLVIPAATMCGITGGGEGGEVTEVS